MMRTLWNYVSSVFFVLSLLPHVGVLSAAGQTRSELLPVKLQLSPFLGSAPFFIAEEEGFFAEQGLEIKLVKMVRSADGVPALAQGELDVLYGSMSIGFLNAIARGARIRFVAEKGYVPSTGCGYHALLARRGLVEEGKLHTAAQLRGRRVDINPVSIESYYLEKLLNAAGLSFNDIEVVDVPTPVMPEALEKGTIDLVATAEPWVTLTLERGNAVIWMPIDKVIPDFQLAAILFGPSLLEKRPEAGRRFIVSYLKAARQYNQGKTDRNLKIIAKHTGLEEGLLRKACWPVLRNDGKINIESILDFQKWGVKRGFLDTVVPSQQFWDPGFVDYANKVLSGSVK